MNRKTQQEIANQGGRHANVRIGVATVLKGESQWVQIFPAEREWYGWDGRGPYRLFNPQAVVEASKVASVLDKAMIDRDHARQLAPAGTPVAAAGWFKDYEAKDDGSIWGFAEWTNKGKAELAEKEYRFFSATFMIDQDTREILSITGGTITNTPNFQNMQALATGQQTQKPNPEKETELMKPELIALAKALGLDHEKHTEEQILAAAQKAQEDLAKMREDVASLAKELKISGDADIAAISKAAKTQIEEAAAKSKDADPNEYVPRSMYDELATRMDNMEKSSSDKAATDAVELAMKEGKIAPAQKDWAEGYAKQDLAGFKAFVEKQPQIIKPGETTASQKKDSEDGSLTAEDIAVAKQMGNDPEDLKPKKKDEGKAA